jgi:hypothetical protein
MKFHGVTTGDDCWVSDADAALAIMLLHPDFPGRHRLDVLARLAGTSWDDPRAAGLALAAARSRGLDERAAQVPDGWITSAERHGLTAAEQVTRILVRAFGTVSNQRISFEAAGSLLGDSAVAEWSRQVASAAQVCNRRLPAGARQQRLRYRDEVIDRAFAQVWHCEPGELEPAVWDRGICSIKEFRRLAEPFVSYLKAGVHLS